MQKENQADIYNIFLTVYDHKCHHLGIDCITFTVSMKIHLNIHAMYGLWPYMSACIVYSAAEVTIGAEWSTLFKYLGPWETGLSF